MNEKHLAQRAADLLRQNDRGRFTVPSPRLYPHQWAWDSAFAAIGWAHLDPERGLVELETLLEGQWEDGRIPHIQFHATDESYFPGPEFWRTERSTSITQPPMWTEAALALLRAGADRDRVAALAPGLERSHLFFHEQRDPLGLGAIAVVHPWESGLDNSPAWDAPLDAVDPSRAPPFQRVDKEKVADASERPTDEHYARYAVLVQEIADSAFGAGSFAVYDPLMTALVARAESCLAALSAELGRETGAAERSAGLRAALEERLWDEKAGRFGFFDARAGRFSAPDLLVGHAPLILDLPAQKRERLLGGLEARYTGSAWPLPTVAPESDLFDPRRYWRGPTWINMNWFFSGVPELSDRLYERSLALVERSGFREYYEPRTGDGLGAEEFTWSAALVLDLLNESC